MSDTLFGKEVSGTPLETRGLANDVAGQFSGLISNPTQGANMISQMFGINPGELGLQQGFQDLFAGGGASKSFQAFDEANQPFQNRAMAGTRASNASQFGTAGGRFSGNLGAANASSDALHEQGFDQNRLNFAQSNRAQDMQALLGTAGMLPGLMQGAMMPLNSAAQFAQVGAPIFQEGIAGDILGAAGNIGGLLATGGMSGITDFFGGMFGGGGGGGTRIGPNVGAGNRNAMQSFNIPGPGNPMPSFPGFFDPSSLATFNSMRGPNPFGR